MTNIVFLVQCTALITAAILVWAYVGAVVRKVLYQPSEAADDSFNH